MKKIINTFMIIMFSLVFVRSADEEGTSKWDSFKKRTLESLKETVSTGKEKLNRFIKGNEENIDSSLQCLNEVVFAATERARRLGEWNITNIEKEAEEKFDQSISAIEEYLSLVEDDGLVHRAANRVRATALEKARLFREKAKAKESSRYLELSKDMETQAAKVTEVWESIVKERENVLRSLKVLKEAKELYIDIKVAKGVEAAVKELEGVRNDLIKISKSMLNVQEAIIGKTPNKNS